MVKNALGVSVNDVVLGLCAGALRKYLDHLDEHPDGPLVAMVPVSVRTEDQKGTHGNQVSIDVVLSLATDIDDPRRAVAEIHEGMAPGEGADQHHRCRHLADWVEFAAPALLGRAVRLYSRHADGRPSPPTVQRDDLERAGTALPAVLRRRADDRALSDGSDLRRRRPQHHR